jgi:hypothetical protein
MPIVELSGGASYTDNAGNVCIVATEASDAIFSAGTATTIIGRNGGDLIFSSGGNAKLYGGEGADIFQVSSGGYIVPGPGRDVVACSAPCTVAILHTCEIESGEDLNGGGSGTLITPVPLSELMAMGVSVSGFSTVRVEQHACESTCAPAQPSCSGHGVCAEGDQPGTMKCACHPGFKGDNCSEGFVKAKRSLGRGRHTLATAQDTFAISYVEEGPPPTSIRLQVLTSLGEQLISSNLSSGTTALLQSHPVVAALPGDLYAVAWNDFGADGDELGVALRLVDPSTSVPGPLQHANAKTNFSQQDPDVLWTGSELLVAWVDGSNPDTAPDLRYRRFNANLVPLSDELPLTAEVDAEADVALAAFAGSWAAAWRAAQNGLETIHVKAGTAHWTVGPFLPGSVDDKPALAEIDATHLLLVYTEGTDPASTSVANVPALRAAVLDVAHPGSAAGLAVYPSPPPVGTGPGAQSQPNAVRAAGELFIAWHGDSPLGDARAEELWLKRVRLSSTNGLLDLSATEIRFPRRTDHQAGDQRQIGLAELTGLMQGGSLVAAWDDLGVGFGPNEGHGDIVAEVVPLPLGPIGPPTCVGVDFNTDGNNCGSCGHSCLGGQCNQGTCRLFAFATGFGGPMGVAVVGSDVYVLDTPNMTIAPASPSGRLVRIAPDGTQTDLESGMTGGNSTLWFDAATNSFMWPDFFAYQNGPMGLEWRAYTRRLDAPRGSVTTLLSNHLGYPFALASNGNSLWVANWGDVPPENLRDTVERRPRSDLSQYTRFYTSANPDAPAHPSHMDVDANFLYWAESQTGRIVRRPLSVSWESGTADEKIIKGSGNARGIAVDGSTIYYSLYGQPNGQPPGRLAKVANQPGQPDANEVVLATVPTGFVEDVAVDAKAIYMAGHSGTIWKLAK